MMEFLHRFFHMGGYGAYVFSAYGSVIFFLVVQWLIPFRLWKNYLRKRHEPHS